MDVLDMDGDAWEEYCIRLLVVRHGNTFQRVPAKRAGDLGLEAYTTDGHTYQCYCPTEPLQAKERFEKHRDKLTQDLGKLVRNRDEIKTMLDQTTISSYTFMVPLWDDSRLLKHATKKAEEIRDASLPFISPDFHVHIRTADDFVAERGALVMAGLQALSLPLPASDPLAVAEWADTNSELAENVRTKAIKLGKNTTETREFVNEVLGWYLSGEHMLEALRQDYPDIWQALRTVRTERERLLAVTSAAASGSGPERLAATVDTLVSEMCDSVPGLTTRQAQGIAWGIAGDWLARCPLDFPKSA